MIFSFRLTRSSNILKNYQSSKHFTILSFMDVLIPGDGLYVRWTFGRELAYKRPGHQLFLFHVLNVFVVIPLIIFMFCSFWVRNCCNSLNVAIGPTKFVTSLFCFFKYQITRISTRNNYYFSGSSIDALFPSDATRSGLFSWSSSSRSTDHFFCEKKETEHM